MRGLALLMLAAACGDNLTHPPAPANAAAPACLPHLDGRLDATGLAPALGVPLTLYVSPAGATVPFDLAGALDVGGHRVWDWSQDASHDRQTTAVATALGAQWFAPHFAGGQWVAPLDVDGALLGVYSEDAAGLWLHGLASAEAAPRLGQTLVVYPSPVALYRFPLEPGAAWTSAADVGDGVVQGLPFVGRDSYDVSVDAAGQLVLPEVVFTEALRVRTTVTRTLGAVPYVVRQVSFVFECFGEVARATSRPGETEADFTRAAEVRRYRLP